MQVKAAECHDYTGGGAIPDTPCCRRLSAPVPGEERQEGAQWGRRLVWRDLRHTAIDH